MVLVALLLSVVFWNVIRLLLTVMAVGFVSLVVVSMAGCGLLAMVSR